jgi:hypothetical protein
MWQDGGMRLSLASLALPALLALAFAPASGLNHFYVVLDHDTYAAIEQSAFLKEQFAVFEKRTTVRADKTYSGIYFYGRQTYLEFLEPSPERPVGGSGMAFGGDAAAEPIEGLKPMTITREWNGVKVPWFFMTTPSWESQDDRFVTWFMTYHADFLTQWHPEARPSGAASSQVSRAAVLERYKAVLLSASTSASTSASSSPALMDDVSGLTLALKAESRPRFEAWTAAIGAAFPVRFVDPGAGIEGIRAAEFRLGRAPDKEETLRFGSHSTLTLRRDRTATWRFE